MIYVFRTYETERVEVFCCDSMDAVRERVGEAELVVRADFGGEDDGYVFTPGRDEALVIIGDAMDGIKEEP